ncbi:hypothetical protein FOFC_15182 [Fusarium oxysporum]|nr:hypothetical protein FOFC_15182 [Fusarium oxysporum]
MGLKWAVQSVQWPWTGPPGPAKLLDWTGLNRRSSPGAHYGPPISHTARLVKRADRISHLAIITLIYRSIQPSSNTGSAFCNECLSSAKQCLEEHKEAFSLLQDAEPSTVELYVQWQVVNA